MRTIHSRGIQSPALQRLHGLLSNQARCFHLSIRGSLIRRTKAVKTTTQSIRVEVVLTAEFIPDLAISDLTTRHRHMRVKMLHRYRLPLAYVDQMADSQCHRLVDVVLHHTTDQELHLLLCRIVPLAHLTQWLRDPRKVFLGRFLTA